MKRRELAIGFAAVVLLLLAFLVYRFTTGSITADHAPLAQGALAAPEAAKLLASAQSGLDDALRGPAESLTTNGIADRLEMSFDAMKRAAENISRDTFDLEAVAASVGHDPSRALDWVRTETQHVPYLGVLRGPNGVLMDRVGNSLDRALLLAELLGRAGIDMRLAHATLSAEATTHLIQQVRATAGREKTQVGDPVAPIADSFIAEYSGKFGTPVEAIQQRLAAKRTAAATVGQEVSRRSTSQAAFLVGLVGDRLQAVPAAVDRSETAAFADHWWVQRRDQGGWIDMDPDQSGGAPFAPLSATEYRSPTQVDEKLWHTLSIRLQVECARDGRLERQLLFEHEMKLADAVNPSIELQQTPVGEPNDAGQEHPERAFRQWLESQTQWLAVLSVNGKPVKTAEFSAGCEIGTGKSKGASGAFAGALGGGEEPSQADGVITAEFIGYDMQVPGSSGRSTERVLFDRLNAAERKNNQIARDSRLGAASVFDLLSFTEIVPIAAQPSPEYVSYSMAQEALARSADFTAAWRTGASAPEPANTVHAPFPTALYELALARRAWNPLGRFAYVPEANVLTRHFGLHAKGADDAVPWSAFDIVFNRTGAMAATGAPGIVELRATQGAVDANAEVFLAAESGDTTNLAERMVIDATLKWDVRDDVGHSNSTSVIVAPVQTGASTGWWSIDTASGDVMELTSIGWGGTIPLSNADQGLAEFVKQNEQQIRSAGAIFRFMMYINCMASAARKVLSQETIGGRKTLGQAAMNMGGKLLFRGALCVGSWYIGTSGILTQGPMGTFLSRIGDIFSIAFSIANW